MIDTKNFTLLYVEDDKDTRETTLLILDDIFDKIIIAVDGEDGLKKFKENKIDLILTDINMPNLNGLNMSCEIKKINKNIPIIILTALTDIDILKKAIDIGIDSFVTKPLEDIEILFNKIDSVLKKLDYDRVQTEQEKAILILDMVKTLSHHWKQPLTVISLVASNCAYKLENNMELNDDDIQKLSNITNKVEELANMFSDIDRLNFETSSLEALKHITHISKEIYK